MKKICRLCGGTEFKEVVNFGDSPLVNNLLEEKDLDNSEITYPLVVEQCQNCFLVQTKEPLSTAQIYSDQDYLYFSSDMPQLSEYFKEYEEEVVEKFLQSKDELVVEIGSNDGIMLQHFKNDGYKVLGVDPSVNVVIRALKEGIPTVSAGFTSQVAKNILKYWGQAKIITANNCIAHIDELNDLMKGVKLLLDEDGVFVLECNYWGGMVKNKNYALIYHDHFSYFTLINWIRYAEKLGLEVFDATVTPAQGGSLRVFMGRPGKHFATNRFNDLLAEEKTTNLNSRETTVKYKKEITDEAKKLKDKIRILKADGKSIAGYGAAAKGFSVLKFANINEKHIDYFVDDSPAKQGKYTPITHIKVISREEAQDRLPDYFFITAPNYEKIIIDKEQIFLEGGGHFLTVDGRII